jgi:hypothetical protein
MEEIIFTLAVWAWVGIALALEVRGVKKADS